MFGRKLIGHNDPDFQEKVVKFNELIANCVMYSTACDITDAANAIAAEGEPVDPADLATVSPYVTTCPPHAAGQPDAGRRLLTSRPRANSKRSCPVPEISSAAWRRVCGNLSAGSAVKRSSNSSWLSTHS